jgi:hypothetical protein
MPFIDSWNLELDPRQRALGVGRTGDQQRSAFDAYGAASGPGFGTEKSANAYADERT